MKLKFRMMSVISCMLAGFSSNASASQASEYVYTFGMGYYHAAKYSGSDEGSDTVIPLFRLQKGNYFIDSLDGIGISAEFENGFYFSQALGYSTGRSDSDASWKAGSEKLRGMGKIRAALNSSTTLGWHLSRDVAVEGTLHAPLTDSQGLSYQAGISYRLFAGTMDTLVLSSNADFGDARHNNLFYGVSGSQSRRSGYNRYSAGGGLYSVNAGLNWTHIFGEHWWSYADVTYQRLTHHVADSPIVFRKEETQLSLGLLYSF